MATQFKGPYQSIYEAGLVRQRESEARQRGMATRQAARSGISSSGVSQLPQDEISREALRSEGDLGARVAQAQEAERLGELEFNRRKQLMELQSSLVEAANAKERAAERKRRKAAGTGRLIGGLVGGIAGSVIPGAGTLAGAKLGMGLGGEE